MSDCNCCTFARRQVEENIHILTEEPNEPCEMENFDFDETLYICKGGKSIDK